MERAGVTKKVLRKELRGGREQFRGAWQGSGVKGIEKFDSKFMGTGEGGARFGWGHYLSSLRDIGEAYREYLKGDSKYDGKNFEDIGKENDAFYAALVQPRTLSRIKSDGRNFVVFDQILVEIKKTYYRKEGDGADTAGAKANEIDEAKELWQEKGV